jgi:hypothetical protein
LDPHHEFAVVELMKNLNDVVYQSNDVYHPIHRHQFFVEMIVVVVVLDQ